MNVAHQKCLSMRFHRPMMGLELANLKTGKLFKQLSRESLPTRFP